MAGGNPSAFSALNGLSPMAPPAQLAELAIFQNLLQTLAKPLAPPQPHAANPLAPFFAALPQAAPKPDLYESLRSVTQYDYLLYWIISIPL